MPERKIFSTDSGLEIAGLDWGGDKPLAILCHANGFCAATWSMVAELLCGKFRVVALDARGHGYSSVPAHADAYHWTHLVDDLLDVTRQLQESTGRDQVALLAGNSLGAIIGAVAAAARPDTYRTVVMLDPPSYPQGEARQAFQRPTVPEGPGSLADITRKRRRVFPSKDAVRASYRKKPIFAEWREDAFTEYLEHGFRTREDGQVELRCPPEVEAAIFERTGSVDVFEEARHVTARVALVHAQQGNFPIEMYRQLIENFPHGQLMSLPGGHLLPMELPEATAALLMDFEAAGRSD